MIQNPHLPQDSAEVQELANRDEIEAMKWAQQAPDTAPGPFPEFRENYTPPKDHSWSEFVVGLVFFIGLVMIATALVLQFFGVLR